MMTGSALYEHVEKHFGWARAAEFIDISPEGLRSAAGWQIRDAFGHLLLASEEARAALLKFPPPADPVNPLSDNDYSYRLVSALHDAFLTDDVVRRYIGEQPVSFLDFGCGSGRILSYLAQFNPPNTFAGCDVVPGGLDHIRAVGIQGDFRVISNTPPTSFETGSFDAILAWSIFSHYSQSYGDIWMSEFRRLLRPGGLVMMTFHPPSSIATLRQDTRPLAPPQETFDAIEADIAQTGFGYRPCYERFEDVGSDYANFGITAMTPEYVRSRWQEQFELREIVQNAVHGWQDMAVFTAR
ncbi:MAG: class I SAM-dependent methyltransferase [Hyphomonadaceae bacterium]|nr:class I SAM-dependent methyltransferase [Hyphomonadaceae bacterium]